MTLLKRYWAATEEGAPAATGELVETPTPAADAPAATEQTPVEEPPAEPGEKGDTVPATWAEVFQHPRFKELNEDRNKFKELAEAVPQLRSQLEAMSEQIGSLKTAAPKPPPEPGLAEQLARDTVKQWMADGMTEDEALEEWRSQSRTLMPIYRNMERMQGTILGKVQDGIKPFQDKDRVTRLSQIGQEVLKDKFYQSGGVNPDDNYLMGLLTLHLRDAGVDPEKLDAQTAVAEAGKMKANFYKTVLPGLFIQAVADKDPACMAGLAQALKAAMTAEIPEVVAVLTEAAEAYDALKDKQNKKFPPLGGGKTPREIKTPDIPAAEPNERSLSRATLAASGLGG